MDNDHSQLRAAPRTNLFIGAVLLLSSAQSAIRIRNLSEAGAMVEGAPRLEIGAKVLLKRGELQASSVVAWVRGSKAGVQFDNPIELEKWLPLGTQVSQEQVDRMFAAARSRALTTVAETISSALDRPTLNSRIAEELELAVRTIELAGEELAGQPLILARHATALQSLDMTMNILSELARVLAADEVASVQNVKIDALKRRLTRGRNSPPKAVETRFSPAPLPR